MTFKSKVDAWLIIVIVAALLSPIVVVLINPNVPRHPAMGNGTLFGIVLVSMLVPGGLIAWLFTTTDYTVTVTELVVRSGPISQRVPLGSITKLVKTRSILSAPALSLDRIEVQYGKHGTLVISPDDKEGFVGAIKARVPAVIVEGIGA